MRPRSVSNPFFFSFLILIALLLVSSIATAGPALEVEQVSRISVDIPSVNNTTGNVTTWSIVTVSMSLVFSFGLLVVAIYANNDFFLKFTAGVVWVFAGIFIYIDYSLGWMAISICVGLYIMVVSAVDFDKKRKGQI